MVDISGVNAQEKTREDVGFEAIEMCDTLGNTMNLDSDDKGSAWIYIVPSTELERKHPELENKSVIYVNPKGNRKVVQLNRLRKLKHLYNDRWEYFKV